jgi:Domain of unknown function (DUF4157)/Domain of unknown function (DUF4765)
MWMREHQQQTSGRQPVPGAGTARPSPGRAAAAGAIGLRSPSALLALQRTAGNAAVVQMLRDEHRHGAGRGHQAPVQRSLVHDVLRSSGRPLDRDKRQEMETRLGADFSEVRVHSDAVAQRSAREVGARAWTSGSHVVLGPDGADDHTLAHELTHVIQQRGGPVDGTAGPDGVKVSDPGDRFELAAEANADRAMAAPLDLQRAPETRPGHLAGPPASPVIPLGPEAGTDVCVQRAKQYQTGATTRDPDSDNYDSDADDFDENIAPHLPEPTPQDTVRQLWSSGSDQAVTLWRGTTLSKAQAMASSGSAGGGTADASTPRPGHAQLQAQIGSGGQEAEFTAAAGVAEGFSYGSALVVVRIKASYLGKGSESESGWIALGSAPVEVIAVIDRTRGQQAGRVSNAS